MFAVITSTVTSITQLGSTVGIGLLLGFLLPSLMGLIGRWFRLALKTTTTTGGQAASSQQPSVIASPPSGRPMIHLVTAVLSETNTKIDTHCKTARYEMRACGDLLWSRNACPQRYPM